MKRVLITGGGSGTGADMARKFAELGHEVVVTGRRRDALDSVAGGRIRAVIADVTDEASVAQMFADAGPCDIVIANAGQAAAAPLRKVSLADWNAMMGVNLTGVFLTFRDGLAQMGDQGRLIAVASVAGLAGAAYAAPYAASKHGVMGLVRSLALEVAKTGVTVNAVCPSYIDTEMTRRTIANIVEKTGRSQEQAIASLTTRNPQGRLIGPDEVTGAVMWLCSDAARGVNGQAVTIDGGGVG